VPETRATLRYSPTSPYKVRAVLDLIRGVEVGEARQQLQLCGRDAADEVLKLLDSAIANAEENDHLPADELYVSRAWADEGPTQKRWRPRARGRGTRIRKRTSHVTVVVARYSDEQLQERARRDAASGRVPDRRRRVQRRRRPQREAAATEEVETTEATEGVETPVEETPVGETPETGSDETRSDETGSDETGSDETGTEETGAEESEQLEAVGDAETEAGASADETEEEA